MSSKKWVIFFISTVFILFTTVGLFNYIVDPLWLFSHENKLNKMQSGFNERLQKTNYLYSRGVEKYDGILLGSSRATYINQNCFVNMNIFNYASSNMYPVEFNEYIQFMKKQKKSDLKYIILGLDFFAFAEVDKLKFEKPEVYISNLENPFYTIKSLLSYDTLKYAKDNIKNLKENKKSFYDRNNIKYHLKVSENNRFKQFSKNLAKHLESFSDKQFKINKNYRNIFETIKKENPNTKIIAYTSPITSELLVSILKNPNRFEDFKIWLEMVVDIFGEIHHFMNINSITKNLQNYPDDDHLYPEYVNYIAYILSNNKKQKIPKDFEIILNKDNFVEFIDNFQKEVIKYNDKKVNK